MSKKKPLLIVCNLANEKETETALSAVNSLGIDRSKATKGEHEEFKGHSPELGENISDNLPVVTKKFLFKCGDDLRQDNLVLQFFKIMDRLW